MNYLVQEPNFIIQKKIFRKFISHRNEKKKPADIHTFMNKRDYLGLSILDISQIVINVWVLVWLHETKM